jgi:DNA-binding CsgD family transcriptional regulator
VKRALGDLDAAERQFDAGLCLARSSNATLVEISCLHGLAATALTRRDMNVAAIALRDALGVPGVSETRPLLADGLEWGAHFMAAVGQPTSSAQIVGAVSCFREHLDVAAPRSLLREREGLVASLRSVLGDATFAMLHADGQIMSNSTAIQAIRDECTATGQDPVVHQTDPLHALTRRERDVLALLREHYTDREIADFLFLSRRTVSSHVASILHKLGVANRKGAAAIAARQGLAAPRMLALTDLNPA